MSKAEEFCRLYGTIIGRNIYNQNRREYVYKRYALTGSYYSDCSSSICATLEQLGMDARDGKYLWNTEDMHYHGRPINVRISGGHIIEGIEKLQRGDCLMFRGNDPNRPLQIGHVEFIYDIQNPSRESGIIIAGHGSDVPSTKNMWEYLERRANLYASNGRSKGLVEALRFLPDENTEDEWSENNMITLKKGAVKKGTPEIYTFQRLMKSLGYYTMDIDGSYGGGSEKACKDFQHVHGLDIDGVCGPKTWKELLTNSTTV